MAEMAVSHSARLRAAFDELMTRQQRRRQAMTELSEHGGEKLVDGQADLALQRAGPDDDRSRAVGMVCGRIQAGTVSTLKAMVAGERGCG